MLLNLSVRDFVVVESLELDFGPGFTVLTGETGAGKSILIDALQLALGDRADTGVIREGAQRAEVAAEFRVDPRAASWLAEAGLVSEGEVALLRRTLDAAGRSRAFINGSPVTLGQLRELAETLVDIHGQHAHQSLLRPAAQLQLLDEHGQLQDLARNVASDYGHLRRARQARVDAETAQAGAASERERLQWMAAELQELAPEAGEWERVAAEHKRLSHAAGLLEGAHAAIDGLAEADLAALGRIDAAAGRLRLLAAFDARLGPVLEVLESARNEVDEAARQLNQYLAHSDLDEARLAAVDQRMAAMHATARKLRCNPEELAALLESTQAQLTALKASSDLDGLREIEAKAAERFAHTAAALSAARRDAALNMSLEVTRAMQDLAMAGGRFAVGLQASEPSATGLEQTEFQVASHEGTVLRPLAKVASGGELSRISLAISVIAASATPVQTLIFDEVDAGIGGAVADVVGRRLKQLGQLRQVLCVTHLPQVAAHGDRHLVVSKVHGSGQRPVSLVAPLDRAGRVEELARMLGGQQITDATRKHARELLAQ
ncbi:MAG TPA: DNA repair protein RecN [Burkholderiaceae bacterium]|nr:DNA repair protein RecN [Burkholderiaceae bacterium]